MYFMPGWFDSPPQHRLADQNFGQAITSDDVLTTNHPSATVAAPAQRDYYRPWKYLASAARDLGSWIMHHPDKLQINLDVQHFTPDEITVKTADGFIVVEGKHEEKKDEHGIIARQFVRKYPLPKGSLPETVESKLSSDGVLIITVPYKVPDEIVKGERVVPINQTGAVRKEIKDLVQIETKEDKKCNTISDPI